MRRDSQTSRESGSQNLKKLKTSQSLNDIDTGKLNFGGSGAQSHRASMKLKTKQTKSQPEDPETKHFDIRHNYNLITHCSKIDESFIDYMLDSDRGNFVVYFDQSLYEAP